MANEQLNVIVKLQDRASTGLKKMNASVNGLQSSLKMMATVAAAAGAFAIGNIAKAALNAAGELERQTVAFTTLTGSAKDANMILKDLAKFAKETPFELVGIRQTAKQMLAMGAATKKNMIPTLNFLGNAVAAVGGDLNRVAFNFGQVAAQGKLTGRELRDFANNGIPVIDLLADSMGVAKNKIRDMTSAGVVGFAELKRAFEKASEEGGMFHDLMVEQAKTFPGLVSNLRDAWDQFLENEGKKVLAWGKNVTKFLITIVEGPLPTMVDTVKKLGIVLAAAFSIKMIQGINLMNLSMTQLAVKAKATTFSMATLGTSIKKIPKMIKIGIALIGITLAFELLDKLIDKINEVRMARVDASAEYQMNSQRDLNLIRAVGDAQDDASKRVLSATEELAAVNKRIESARDMGIFKSKKNEAELTSALKQRAAILADVENLTGKLSKTQQEAARRNLANFDKLTGKGISTDIDVTTDGGGGGAAKKAADELLKQQEKIRESLTDTQDGFRDLRLNARNALVNLARDHEQNMAKMDEQAGELIASLKELQTAFQIEVGGFDKSAAERVIEQENVIKDLEEQIAEKGAEGENTSELRNRLEKERGVLRSFLEGNKDLEDEIAEARRRSQLTDFSRFIEDLTARREESKKEFEEKKLQLEEEVAALEAQRIEEEKIFNQKRIVIQNINEAIKNNWSNILGEMEKRTELFAEIAKSKLESVKAAFDAVSGLVGEGTSTETLNQVRDFGGGGTVINISGNTLLDEEAAEKIGDLIVGRLNMHAAT